MLFRSWNKSYFGYYSPGIPEQLESKQSQINMILAFMTEAADKSKSPVLFYQQTSACDRLKNDRFACFVVGEVRDNRGNYYNFVGDTVEAFKAAGLNYYNEALLS